MAEVLDSWGDVMSDEIRKTDLGTSLLDQWLSLHVHSIPGKECSTCCAVQPKKKKDNFGIRL